MSAPVKTGHVYLQPRKAGKKWKLMGLSLYPHNSSGVGRLEIQDMRGGGVGGDIGAGIRRHHQPHGDRKLKVFRLSEVISVLRLPPNAEACPMENMAAFCVETEERTLVFAAAKDQCVDWLELLCHTAFQRSEGCGSSSQLHMEENQIYASADEASDFWVMVQQTDAAARCGLQGAYWLQVGQEALVLRDPQRSSSSVKEWPYRLLRRYGKDKMTLSIEAGRRCDSGPGTFTFDTEQANHIFFLIENAIKHQKASAVTSTNQYQEGERVMMTTRLPHSPLPKIPDMTTMTAILANEPIEEFKKSNSSEESLYAQPADLMGSLSLGVSLLPLPVVGTRYNPSASQPSGQSETVYDDPADLIHSVPKPAVTTTRSRHVDPGVTTAVYVDPASYLPIKPPSSTTVTDPIYSEVYDKVSPVPNKNHEPIYTKPVRGLERESAENDSKTDPFAHLYAQVCKTAPPVSASTSSYPSESQACSASSSPVSSTSHAPSSDTIPFPVSISTTTDTDQSLSDVIYESMGI